MARVVRKEVDYSQGHCYGPRPSLAGSDNVIVEGAGVVRGGLDVYGYSHSCGDNSHVMPTCEGSSNVFVNGCPMHRSGDLILCGDRGGNGSLTVFCN